MTYALERISIPAYPEAMETLPTATLGGNIRRLRIAAGFETQAALADKMGVHSQTISDWENDRREELDMKSMFKLAKALNTGLDDLVEGLDPDYDTLRSDLVRHGVPADSVHAAAATRLLEEHRAQNRALVLEMQAAIDALGDITVKLDPEAGRAQMSKPGRSPGRRKAG